MNGLMGSNVTKNVTITFLSHSCHILSPEMCRNRDAIISDPPAPDRSLKGSVVMAGAGNMGGTVEPAYNALDTAENRVPAILLPVSNRRQLERDAR